MRAYVEAAARGTSSSAADGESDLATMALRQALTASVRADLGSFKSGSLLAGTAREEKAAALLVVSDALGVSAGEAPGAPRLRPGGPRGQGGRPRAAAARIVRGEARGAPLGAARRRGGRAVARGRRRLLTTAANVLCVDGRAVVAPTLLDEARTTQAVEEASERWGGAAPPHPSRSTARRTSAPRTRRGSRACMAYAATEASRRGSSPAALGQMIRELGLTSSARHRFYASGGGRTEVGEAGGAWSAGSAVEVSLAVEDARRSGPPWRHERVRGRVELAAFQSAASWGLRGSASTRVRDMGLCLGVDVEKVDAILDQGRL